MSGQIQEVQGQRVPGVCCLHGEAQQGNATVAMIIFKCMCGKYWKQQRQMQMLLRSTLILASNRTLT